MERRTYEGHMDWEYHGQGPVDPQSPWITGLQQQQRTQSNMANSFATGNGGSPQRPSMQPPKASVFSPQLQSKKVAAPFRNPTFHTAAPSFTTPRKPFEDVTFSEISGAESSPPVPSPALTDNSEVPVDTPEQDRQDELAKMTIRVLPPSRKGHLSGKGSIPRRLALFDRDKVRKRQRYNEDRDVGSVRYRIEETSTRPDGDESDDTDAAPRSRRRGKRGSTSGAKQGWLGNLFGAIQAHPTVPFILSYWLQLILNLFIISMIIYVIWSFIYILRADFAQANDKARADKLAEMKACSDNFMSNQCSPEHKRLPALAEPCKIWAACMKQDPDNVPRVQTSARQVIEIFNEIGENISWKTWGLLLSVLLVALLANNIGFSSYRGHGMSGSYVAAKPFPDAPQAGGSSNGGAPPMAHHDPNQAYIWAPIGATPSRRTLRDAANEFFFDTSLDAGASDTENSNFNSPAEPQQSLQGRALKALPAPPQTPSRTGRSPTRRGELDGVFGSPSKSRRGSPNKFF